MAPSPRISLALLSLIPLLARPSSARPMADDAAKLLEPFPKAKEGMARHVISLPPQEDEYSFRVELQLGKTVLTDAHNRYFFGGRLEEETIPGWGYSYVILRQLGPMAGTLMGLDPAAPKVERFITLGGEPELRRYNSRLPLVVYAPADVEVRYRIWTAEEKVDVAAQG